jgi:hypothetical protein
MAKCQKPTRSSKTIRYEKAHKIERLLLLDRKPAMSKRSRQTLLNISMTYALSGSRA